MEIGGEFDTGLTIGPAESESDGSKGDKVTNCMAIALPAIALPPISTGPPKSVWRRVPQHPSFGRTRPDLQARCVENRRMEHDGIKLIFVLDNT